ncbi:L-ribulose-5-phosphate 3-epimerase [Fundicoccus sp. Sow4_F4]|uniref:L-ribulose-5-phosphate 3-epimerase n=1 Tax=Fundicoccus sp. Sow4_F4 TaxID=3438783 RepID=UPI003F909D4B
MTTIGIYEKALPKNISWFERLSLAKELGFDFVEMSIDETDERISRLDWSSEEKNDVYKAIIETDVKIFSICLSAHRRFPFGSSDPKIRSKALEIMDKAINLASDLGIRNIQLAGYDVYYEDKTDLSREFFIENLIKATNMAAAKQVMLSIEIMDDPFINSLTKFKKIKEQIPSPWLQAYPDIGNISAWPENNLGYELESGLENIVAVHVKDTINVSADFPGKFKEVPWGKGNVDFLSAFKTLKRLGYQGAFMIEMWSETEDNPKSAIKEAQEFIYPIFKEAGYDI